MVTAAAPKGLGKGLQALMSDSYSRGTTPLTTADIITQVTGGDAIRLLPLDALVAGKYQPRRHFNAEELTELAASLKEHGVLQPIVARHVNGVYEIIAGERRWRAAKLAKLEQIPVIVRTLTDTQALEVGLIENVQRKDLNPLEEGAGYRRLIEEFQYTQETLANVVGKSRSHVANLLRLEALPERIKAMIDSGDLTMGHARAILSAKDPEALAEQIVAVRMSVRGAEELVRQQNNEPADNQAKKPSSPRAASHADAPTDQDVADLEAMLSETLGLDVHIHSKNGNAGEVIIRYASLSQLDTILKRLGNGF